MTQKPLESYGEGLGEGCCPPWCQNGPAGWALGRSQGSLVMSEGRASWVRTKVLPGLWEVLQFPGWVPTLNGQGPTPTTPRSSWESGTHGSTSTYSRPSPPGSVSLNTRRL